MSRQDSKLQRWIERPLLATGLALILVYASARIHAVVMYHAGLRSFAALSQTGPEMGFFAVSKMLRSATDLNLRHCIKNSFTPSTTSAL